MKRAATTILGLLLIAIAASAGEQKSGDQYSELSFLVVKDENGKPVRNAAIVLHQVDGHGHQRGGGFELKTDAEGKTSYAGVPYGKLRVQVLMTGFQTFGDDFEVNQPKQEITIKLKRPQKQYSIYDK